LDNLTGTRLRLFQFLEKMQIRNGPEIGGWHAERREDTASAWTSATVLWAYLENNLSTTQSFKEGVDFLRRVQVRMNGKSLGWPNQIQEKVDMTHSTAYSLMVLLQNPTEQNMPHIFDGVQRLLDQQNKKNGGFGVASADEEESWTRITSLCLVVFLQCLATVRSHDKLIHPPNQGKLESRLLEASEACIRWLIANKKEEKLNGKTLVYWPSSDRSRETASVSATAMAMLALSKMGKSTEGQSRLPKLDIQRQDLDLLLDQAATFIVSKKEKDDSFPDSEERKIVPTRFYQSKALGTPLAILALCEIKPHDSAFHHVISQATLYLVNSFMSTEDGALYYSISEGEESVWATAYAFAALGSVHKVVELHEKEWLVNLRVGLGKLQDEIRNLEKGVIRNANDQLKDRVTKSFKAAGLPGISIAVLFFGAYFASSLIDEVELLGTLIIFATICYAAFCRTFRKPRMATPSKLSALPGNAVTLSVDDLTLYDRELEEVQTFISAAKGKIQDFADLVLWKKKVRFLMLSLLSIAPISALLETLLTALVGFRAFATVLIFASGVSASLLFLLVAIYLKPSILIAI
jgi:hypothetical protein